MYTIRETLLCVCLHLQGGEGVPEPPGADVSVRLVTQESLPGPGPVCGLQPPLAQPHGLGGDHGHGLVWLQLPEQNILIYISDITEQRKIVIKAHLSYQRPRGL